MKTKLIKAVEMLKQNKENYLKTLVENKTPVSNEYYMGRIDEINFTIWLIEEIILKEEK